MIVVPRDGSISADTRQEAEQLADVLCCQVFVRVDGETTCIGPAEDDADGNGERKPARRHVWIHRDADRCKQPTG